MTRQPALRGASAVAAIVLVAVLLPHAAAAQRPHGMPPGLAKKGAQAQGGGGAPGSPGGDVALGPAVRSFGVWLDDATVLAPREAWLTVSFVRWASPSLVGFDMPVSDVSVGVAPRVQLSASVPFAQYGSPGAPLEGQLGDLYFAAKWLVRSPSEGAVGVAVTPALEVLSNAATSGTDLSRVQFVLPVSVERRFEQGRVYGSAGYFTRGAWFAGAAFDHPVGSRAVAAMALTYSRSTAPAEASTAWGLGRQRVDASGSLSWIVSPRLVVFGGLGRTLSHLDPDATRYAVSFGASMDLRRQQPSRPPIRP